MRFIDLFAGLGGFHIALKELGHECVFANELRQDLADLYVRNFGTGSGMVSGDIRSIPADKIPPHDILCAGFPCQPFSKAGDQAGFKSESNGDMFDEIMRIVEHRRPPYILLENVPNLEQHNHGKTWRHIYDSLERAGYSIDNRHLSPHQFGIPQHRVRVFIVASLDGLDGFDWPRPATKSHELNIRNVLDKKPLDAKPISQQLVDVFNVWQDFLNRFPEKESLPSFPIWSMEFGATYPYEQETPQSIGLTRLAGYLGSHGTPLQNSETEELVRAALPSHALNGGRAHTHVPNRYPDWKIQFIRQNRELYQRHKSWIDEWMPQILNYPSSLQKLEWNCKGEKRNIWNYIIQIRASGVRVKRPQTAPSLVAMTTTQVPIIAWERRYMTPREAARLQSMDASQLQFLPETSGVAYKSLGNAVNSHLVKIVARALIERNSDVARQVMLPQFLADNRVTIK